MVGLGKPLTLISVLLTCNEDTCGVVFGCLDFCFSEGRGVYWELSIIQPVSSQHPVNTAVIGTLKTSTCKEVLVLHVSKRNF